MTRHNCPTQLLWVTLLHLVTAAHGMRLTCSVGAARDWSHTSSSSAESPSNRYRSWVQVPARGSSGSIDEEPCQDMKTIRVISYNILGPRYSINPDCAFVTWPKRREKLEAEIREYHHLAGDGLHAVCLQEVTPQNLQDTWIPFMKDLGLDGFAYKAKRPGDSYSRKHRCYGVVIFYSTKHLEVMRETGVYFAHEVHQLQRQRSKLGYCRKRGRSRPTVRRQVIPEIVDASGEGCNRALPMTDHDWVLSGSFDGVGDPAGGGDDEQGGDDDYEYERVSLSYLEEDLRKMSDAAVIVRFKLRRPELGPGAVEAIGDGQGPAEQQRGQVVSFTLVCCHLRYDPVRPDLKTAQCHLLFGAINRFHRECGVYSTVGGDGDWDPQRAGIEAPGAGGGGPSPAQDERDGQGGGEAVNLVLCGDFNSVPLLQPQYLPGALQAMGMEALSANGKQLSSDGGDCHSLPHPPAYPSNEGSASGVYSLLAYGRVSPTHPEHPDTFIPSFLERDVSRFSHKWNRRRQRLRKKKLKSKGALHHVYGEWSSGFGESLEDVYRDRGDASPRFTTNTRSFSGLIDHIFVSAGDPRGLMVRSVLGFPPGANMGPGGSEREGQHEDGVDRSAEPATSAGDEGGGDEACNGFICIPSGIWASDHLALGVEVALPYRSIGR